MKIDESMITSEPFYPLFIPCSFLSLDEDDRLKEVKDSLAIVLDNLNSFVVNRYLTTEEIGTLIKNGFIITTTVSTYDKGVKVHVKKSIVELIKRRRFQMLVHSYIYYKMDSNIITDYQWSKWATELAKLQRDYHEESKEAPLHDDFNGWNGSSGAYLPLNKYPWVKFRAECLIKKFG